MEMIIKLRDKYSKEYELELFTLLDGHGNEKEEEVSFYYYTQEWDVCLDFSKQNVKELIDSLTLLYNKMR